MLTIKTTVENIDAISVSESLTCDLDHCIPPNINLQNNLKILNQNIRSIKKNMAGLHTVLNRTSVEWDVILLTECWLRDNSATEDIGGYNCFKTTRNYTQNEGVVIYIKENYYVTVQEPDFDDANCLLMTIDNNTILIALYRPPSHTDINNFLNSLCNILSTIAHYNTIILAGDMNINISDDCNNANKNQYLNVLASFGLLPAHTLPTRQSACLDHIVLKTKFPAITIVANSALTDHEVVLLYLAKRVTLDRSKKTLVRIDYDQLHKDFEQIDFKAVFQSQDANIAAQLLVNIIRNVIQNNTKKIKVPNRKQILKPWITPGLLRCIRHRDSMHKKLKRKPNNDILKQSYRRYRNFCNSLLKRLKREYERQEINKAGKNNKQLWGVINNITCRFKERETANHLLSLSSTPKRSVNLINDYFINVGKNLAEKCLPPNNIKPLTRTNINAKSMVILPIEEREVRNIIVDLRTNAAAGWDEISAGILKAHADKIVPPLTYVCNLALAGGSFPKAFKKSIVHPIFKSGDRNCLCNYRPIAVLSTFSKILERIMNGRLVDFLEANNLLAPSQYGFRTGKSTADAVHDLTNYIVTNMDKGDKVLGIFLDIAKAFDTVSVPILIRKLEDVGVRGTQLDLYKDYLIGRTQCVKINQYTSEESTISYGVPQGSVLGPTLFLIYINDLGMLPLSNGKIITFADDTALLFSGETWWEVFNSAQSGLDVVATYLKNNLLTLNADKTKYLTFTIKSIPQISNHLNIIAHTCPDPHNSCSCTHLKRVESVKYLGIIIDGNLRFHSYINSLNSRLRKLVYIFKTLRHVADENVCKTVYYSLVQSLITYCIISWGGAHKSTILELEKTQRLILKVIFFLPFRYPTTDLYQKANVLSVRQLFLLNIILKQHGQLKFSSEPSRQCRRCVPVYRFAAKLTTQFSKRFFCYLGGSLYNRVHKILSIYALTKHLCKKKVSRWLQGLSYDNTENLLSSPV